MDASIPLLGGGLGTVGLSLGLNAAWYEEDVVLGGGLGVSVVGKNGLGLSSNAGMQWSQSGGFGGSLGAGVGYYAAAPNGNALNVFGGGLSLDYYGGELGWSASANYMAVGASINSSGGFNAGFNFNWVASAYMNGVDLGPLNGIVDNTYGKSPFKGQWPLDTTGMNPLLNGLFDGSDRKNQTTANRIAAEGDYVKSSAANVAGSTAPAVNIDAGWAAWDMISSALGAAAQAVGVAASNVSEFVSGLFTGSTSASNTAINQAQSAKDEQYRKYVNSLFRGGSSGNPALKYDWSTQYSFTDPDDMYNAAMLPGWDATPNPFAGMGEDVLLNQYTEAKNEELLKRQQAMKDDKYPLSIIRYEGGGLLKHSVTSVLGPDGRYHTMDPMPKGTFEGNIRYNNSGNTLLPETCIDGDRAADGKIIRTTTVSGDRARTIIEAMQKLNGKKWTTVDGLFDCRDMNNIFYETAKGSSSPFRKSA